MKETNYMIKQIQSSKTVSWIKKLTQMHKTTERCVIVGQLKLQLEKSWLGADKHFVLVGRNNPLESIK